MRKKQQNRMPSMWPGQTGRDIGMEFAQKTATYATPWVVWILAGIGAALAHWRWGGDPMVTPFITLVIAGSGTALALFARKLAAKSGDRVRRELYTINAAALTVGVTVGLVAGMTRQVVLSSWVIGGVVLCLANTVRLHMGPSATASEGGKWAKVQDKLQLGAYEAKQVQTNGRGTVTAEIEANDGATVEEFQKKIPALSAAYGIGKGRMTVTEDPDDASRATLRATPVDLLKEPVSWPGPSHPGASIAQPVRTALYEDGEEHYVTLPGQVPEEGNIDHLLVMGTTGSGKSEYGRGLVTEALTRTDVHVIAIDIAKGHQIFGAIRHGLTLFITEAATARQLFKVLPTVIKDRTDYLAEQGLKGWKPGCGLSFLVIWGEEAADFAADSSDYDELLRKARSAGIWIATSLQRATYQNVSTEARANHGASACFGVRDASDADFALPDEVIEAGAIPAWGQRKPGYHYFVGMATPEDRWTMMLRGNKTKDRELARAVSEGNEYREPLDTITTSGLGALYQNRTVYTTPLLGDEPDTIQNQGHSPAGSTAVHPDNGSASADVSAETLGALLAAASRDSGVDSETLAEAAANSNMTDDPDTLRDAIKDYFNNPEKPLTGKQSDDNPQPEYEELDMSDADVAEEVAELRDMLGDLDDMDPEPNETYPATGINDELPDLDPDTSLTFEDETERLTKDEALTRLYDQLDAWINEGKTTFTPNDLSHIWMHAPRNRRWFYEVRDELEEAGVIAEDDKFGVYCLLRSPRNGNASDTE